MRAVARRVPAAPFSSLLRDGSDDASSLDWLLESSDPVGAARAEPGPEVALLASETRAAVRAAVATLDAPERQAILLAYRDGLSQSEIAARLGWPLGTVKTRTRRALRAMRTSSNDPQPTVPMSALGWPPRDRRSHAIPESGGTGSS